VAENVRGTLTGGGGGGGGGDGNLDWYKGEFVDRAETRSHEAMTQIVLSRPAVRAAVSNENRAAKSGAPQRGRPRGAGAKARAAKLLEHLAADYNEGSSRAVGYLLRKVWRSMYSGIIINDVGVERVRALQLRRAEAGPMLMLPTHRSCVCTSSSSRATYASSHRPLPRSPVSFMYRYILRES
jgi:hypothetical protein